MTHEQIEQQDLIEQYLLEKLSPELREDFEEHYIGCPECVERLESSRQWIAGVKEFAPNTGSLRPARPLVPRRTWSLVAGLVAVGLAVLVWRPVQRPVKVPRQQPAAPAGALVIELQSFRGVRPAAAPNLSAAAAAKPFSLRLDIRGLAPFLTYSVYIVNDSGKQAWGVEGIKSSSDDWLHVRVENTTLEPGGYWVRLAGIRPGEPPQLLREYSLVVGP